MSPSYCNQVIVNAMIDRRQAEKITDEHIASSDSIAPGYRLSRGDSVVVDPGWYFDYKIVCDLDIPEAEQEHFAGAPGFVVNKQSGAVSAVSHHDWVDLGLAFHDKPYGA